jgi:hypothetical protein
MNNLSFERHVVFCIILRFMLRVVQLIYPPSPHFLLNDPKILCVYNKLSPLSYVFAQKIWKTISTRKGVAYNEGPRNLATKDYRQCAQQDTKQKQYKAQRKTHLLSNLRGESEIVLRAFYKIYKRSNKLSKILEMRNYYYYCSYKKTRLWFENLNNFITFSFKFKSQLTYKYCTKHW